MKQMMLVSVAVLVLSLGAQQPPAIRHDEVSSGRKAGHEKRSNE